jgi:hypothetical protein
MHQSSKKQLLHNDLDKFAVGYFAEKGLPSASGPFIEELKHRGILIDLGDEVSFKFDCVRAFFLSISIKESPELFNYAMTPEGFTLLSEELDYFTGKNRNNKEALIGALKVVDHYFNEADFKLDLNLFDTIALDESPITDALREILHKKLLGDQPTLEKQEELLDQIDSPYSPSVKAHEIPEASGEVSGFFISLQTASAILRNSELINDANLKMESYSKLVRYWCQILLAVVASIELYFDQEEKVAVQETIAGMPKEFSKYMLKMFIPNAIFAMARESLGTSKLELMIAKDIEDSTENVCKLFSTVLYADLELNNRLTMLNNLSKINHPSRFLLELIFFKLMHLFMFRRLSSKEADQIKLILAEIYSQLNSTKNILQTSNIRSGFLSKLDRKKLIRSFNASPNTKD